MLSAFLQRRSLAMLKKGVSSVTRPMSTLQKSSVPSTDAPIDANNETTATTATTAPVAKKYDIASFPISAHFVASLQKMGINEFTPIQGQTYLPIIEGKNVLARARTGTGKTIAFVLPIVELIQRLKANNQITNQPGQPTALILSPTRELSRQIASVTNQMAPGFSVSTLYGGVSYSVQERELSSKVDIVIGTPGRIIDQIERGKLDLSKVKFFALDEADEMLRIGFQQDVEFILKTVPKNRQTMLFSATIPSMIKKIIDRFMSNHVTVDLIGDDANKTAKTVKHLAVKAHVSNREAVLGDILTMYDPERAIVFTNTKRDATELSMSPFLKMSSSSLHGDIDQAQREITMQGFRDGKISCLIATNVAARGLDIPEVDLVIQYGLPDDTESYVHRSGRTGRAGREGTSIVIFTHREESELANFERTCGIRFARKPAPHYLKVFEAAGQRAARLVGTVDPAVSAHFNQVAETLSQERGIHALASALAMISGRTQVTPRSIMSGRDGYVTILVNDSRPFTNNSQAWSHLRRLVGPEYDMTVGDIGLTATGFVAEVSHEICEYLISQHPTKVSEAIDLPELIPARPAMGESKDVRRAPDSDVRGRYGYLC
eukprot:TRINITY_DN370_c0_g4_i1.p1 TRINITY_DN370_c0_g4~~TRINITY_DN370_c0_g4_i1.p1  ORF type:complete len:606 (-),score=110.94 TRINITY_DN370_c0_g4_i1:800-2617(-)